MSRARLFLLTAFTVVLAAAIIAARTLHSFDTFWILRAGDELLSRHSIPAHDPFSFTSDKPWLNHEWLSEIAIALIYRLRGFPALICLQSLCVATTIALLIPRFNRASFYFAVPLCLAAFILGEAVEPRAQLFSWVLFAATLRLSLHDLDHPSIPSWRLFFVWPIGLLWANLHGGDPTGVAVLGLLFLSRPSPRRLLACAGAALLTCANPYGVRVHAHFLGAHAQLIEIREWAPLSDSLANGSLMHWLFIALAIAAALSLFLRARRNGEVRFEALLLFVFTAIAIRYVRFSTQGTLVAAAILARSIPSLESSSIRKQSIALACALSLLVLCNLGSRRSFGAGLAENRFPVAAAAWLKSHRPPGPLFNSYNYGGYLMWSVPEYPVFIDGRAFTVYSNELFSDFLAVYERPETFRKLESRYGLRLAVLQRAGRGAAFLNWLRLQPDWRIAWEDNLSVIATRQ